MTYQALASVYEVTQDGATGERVGTGTLIEPDMVLVHAQLNRELSSADATKMPPRLRVTINSSAALGGEIIDVSTVILGSMEGVGEEPLVGLGLVRPAISPAAVLPSDEGQLAPVLLWIITQGSTGQILTDDSLCRKLGLCR